MSINEALHVERVAKYLSDLEVKVWEFELGVTSYARLVGLCRELDIELDGVNVPGSAAAILNAIRKILRDLEEEE